MVQYKKNGVSFGKTSCVGCGATCLPRVRARSVHGGDLPDEGRLFARHHSGLCVTGAGAAFALSLATSLCLRHCLFLFLPKSPHKTERQIVVNRLLQASFPKDAMISEEVCTALL